MRLTTAATLFVLAWTVLSDPTRADAFASRRETPPFCTTPRFQAIFRMPLKVAVRDIAAPLTAISSLYIEKNRTADCLSLEPGMTYESLLAEYAENQWIADMTGETPATSATVMDAIRATAQRRKSVTDAEADQMQYLTRRLAAYRRSFQVVVPDPTATAARWLDNIELTVVNVSKWPIQWYPGIGPSPEIWFQATPESGPVKFTCFRSLHTGSQLEVLMYPGRRLDVLCTQIGTSAHRDMPHPDLNSVGVPDRWAVHPQLNMAGPASRDNIDVSLWSLDVGRQANILLKGASCRDYGSCPQPPKSQNQQRPSSGGSGLLVVSLAGFFIGVISFLIVRSVTGASAKGTAIALSLFLVLGMAGVTASTFSAISRTHDGFALLGLGTIWFALLIAAAPALFGIWITYSLAVPTPGDEDSEAQPRSERKHFVIAIGALSLGWLVLYSLAQLSSVGSLFSLIFSWLSYGLAGLGALSVIIWTARGILLAAFRPESDSE
jgi:hypothetical protein